MFRSLRQISMLAAVSAPLLAASSASAAVVSADFNGLNDGSLKNQAGGVGFADASSWGTGNTSVVTVTSSDLTAPTSTNYNLTQSATTARKVRITSTGTDSSNDRVLHRDLAAPLTNVIWGSFLVNVPATSGGTALAGIAFNNATDSFISFSGTQMLVVDGSDVVYRNNATNTELGRATNQVTLGSTALILFRIDYNASSPTKGISVWVDPNLLEALPAPDLFSATIGNGSISRLSVGGRASAEIDAIYLSNDADAFTDVTGQPFVVPEPGSLSLIGLGAMLIAGRAR